MIRVDIDMDDDMNYEAAAPDHKDDHQSQHHLPDFVKVLFRDKQMRRFKKLVKDLDFQLSH